MDAAAFRRCSALGVSWLPRIRPARFNVLTVALLHTSAEILGFRNEVTGLSLIVVSVEFAT